MENKNTSWWDLIISFILWWLLPDSSFYSSTEDFWYILCRGFLFDGPWLVKVITGNNDGFNFPAEGRNKWQLIKWPLVAPLKIQFWCSLFPSIHVSGVTLQWSGWESYSDSLTNNPFENFLRIGGNFQTFLLFILSNPITQSSKQPRHSIHQNCCFHIMAFLSSHPPWSLSK